MKDKITETLLEALRQAMAEAGEQRLYKSGKLEGLFASRSGVPAAAAAKALQEGLLEVVRTETKGKTMIEWSRITPRGVDFLHESESPVRVLEELREILQMSRAGMPLWMEKLQQDWRLAGERLAEDMQRLTQRIESLDQRVEAALRRADLSSIPVSNEAESAVPWAREALAYLDRRRDTGKAGRCTLPEMFAALQQQRPDLSIPDFLSGLRRLYECRTVQLLPFPGALDELPEPEYVLLDGAAVFYYVTR